MDKNQSLLVEAIRTAERAVALLKECRIKKIDDPGSKSRIQALAKAAKDELAISQTAITDMINGLAALNRKLGDR